MSGVRDAGDVRDAIGRLRESWAWLGELVEPGTETSGGRVLTDVERERLAELAAAERADRYPRPRYDPHYLADRHRRPAEDVLSRAPAGHGALAATSAPARLSIVEAQAQVRAIVVDAARAVAAAARAVYVGRAGPDAVPAALVWLDGVPARWVATADGVVWPRPPGGVLHQVELGEVPADLAAIAAGLDRADRIAREAAGVAATLTAPWPDRCPACRLRSLQLHHDGDQRHQRAWYVACVSEACVCAGAGCGCRQQVRYAGRRHAWARGELDGPYGLWAAVAAAHTPRPPVGSTRQGHGRGWRAAATVPSIELRGRRYVTAGEAVRLISRRGDVTEAMMRQWARRRGIPSIRIPDGVYYPLQDLLAAEAATAASAAGRRRPGESG